MVTDFLGNEIKVGSYIAYYKKTGYVENILAKVTGFTPKGNIKVNTLDVYNEEYFFKYYLTKKNKKNTKYLFDKKRIIIDKYGRYKWVLYLEPQTLQYIGRCTVVNPPEWCKLAFELDNRLFEYVKLCDINKWTRDGIPPKLKK